MIRLAIVVEGHTELAFVNRILAKSLPLLSITPINLGGGRISVERILKYAKRLVNQYDHVTTLVDYYRFSNPRREKSIEDLEHEIASRLTEKFTPYLQKYEFEALIFSDLTVLSKIPSKYQRIPPEAINHDQPPSKVIKQYYEDYDKVLNGVDYLQQIGITKIKAQCPRFSEWFGRLSRLKKP